MASRNSFLDSPSFRKITAPQRDNIRRVRRKKGFRGGGSSRDPIRRETAAERTQRLRQESLKTLQSELSAKNIKLTASERKQILAGKSIEDIRTSIVERQRRQAISRQQNRAREQRQEQKQRGFTTKTVIQRAPIVRASPAFKRKAQELLQPTRQADKEFVGPRLPERGPQGTVNPVTRPENELFFEGLTRDILSRQQRTTGNDFLSGTKRVGLGIAQIGSEAATFAEGTARFLDPRPLINPEAQAKRTRVRQGTADFAKGLFTGITTQPTQTLFDLSETGAQAISSARTGFGGQPELAIGKTIGNVGSIAAPFAATSTAQKISAKLAPLRKDFISPQRVRGRTTSVRAEGVTTKELDEVIVPNIPSADGTRFDTIVLKGGTASTAEDLGTQVGRAGTTVTGTSATSGLLPLGRREGTRQLRAIEGDIENTFFITPSPQLRQSRLGIGDTDGSFLSDLFSGNAQIGLTGSRPQALVIRQADIEQFPAGLRSKIRKDPSLQSLSQQDIQRIQDFQLERRSGFSVPGKITVESEAVSTAELLDFERVGTFTSGGRRVPIFDVNTRLANVQAKSALDTPQLQTPSADFDSLLTRREPSRQISGTDLTASAGIALDRVFRQPKNFGTVTNISTSSQPIKFDTPTIPLSSPSSPSLFPSRTLVGSNAPLGSSGLLTGASRSLSGSGSLGGGGSIGRIIGRQPSKPSTPPSPPPTFLRPPPRRTTRKSPIRRPPRITTNIIPPTTPTPRRPLDLDFDFDKQPKKKKKDKKKRSRSPFAFRSSLTGIELGIKEPSKKATGFKGLRIRGI